MTIKEIIKEIEQLPYEKRLLIEKALRSMKKVETDNQLRLAADALYDNYKNDKELTAFTVLDGEEFYEPR